MPIHQLRSAIERSNKINSSLEQKMLTREEMKLLALVTLEQVRIILPVVEAPVEMEYLESLRRRLSLLHKAL